jgi:transposase
MGKTQKEVSSIVGFNESTIGSWRKKYTNSGLSFLHDQPRPGRPIVIDGEQRAKITALACEETPEGYSHWSLRVLADKVVELGICEQISFKQVNTILKKTN